MAKKKTEPKVSTMEEKINLNPLYMKICESSSACPAEKKLSDLGNMTILVCTQCFHIFKWQAVVAEKPEKPEKPKVEKVAKTKAVETVVAEAVIVDDQDEAIRKNAEDIQKSFAEVDAITSAKPKPIPAPVAVMEIIKDDEEDFGAFEEKEEVKVEETEGVFDILDFNIISETEINLICNTGNNKTRFLVKTTTSAEKVKVITAKPEVLKGKKAKVAFKGRDEKNRPIAPDFLGLAK